MGRRYIIEHVAQTYRLRQIDRAYQIYTTDALKAIADNCIKYFGRDNTAEALTRRFAEIMSPRKEDERTAEEVAQDIMKNAGLSFKPKGGQDERF